METLLSGMQRPDIGAPPPYEHSSDAPFLLAEMRTTRTEVVTTTTTETTTHLLSLPRRTNSNRNQMPVAQSNDADDSSSRQSVHTTNSPVSDTLFLNKALPPTPPAERLHNDHIGVAATDSTNTRASTLTSTFPDSQIPTRKASAGTVALAHAALGLGLPHASVAFPRLEGDIVPFSSTSSVLPSPVITPSAVRRVKSLHLFQKGHSFEGQENHFKMKDPKESERRQRGLSFSTSSFLNHPDVKSKGEDFQELPLEIESPKVARKSLSRKPSFWNRKKESRQPELQSSNPLKETKGDAVFTLPPLPPVYQYSPFNISEFPSVPAMNSKRHPPSLVFRPGSYLEETHNSNSVVGPPNMPNEVSSSSCPSPLRPKPSDKDPDSPVPKVHLSAAPKPRRQISTPFLHRLSLAVFSSGDMSPAPGLLNGHLQPLTSPIYRDSPQKRETSVPKPLDEDGESPEIYLARLQSVVTRAEVAGILASSPDPFYSRALQAYVNQFDFFSIPLDVALRKLLMEVGLPRETQQIDRVMEAFASRYMHCNPDTFTSEDHPYILAFSLIMLHTDAFNPSNKRKMSKADYIKNTRLPGIPTEILDYFFDNIVFAPFIFIEDPVDFNGQPRLLPNIKRPASMAVDNHISSPLSAGGSASFRIGNKIDPYFLILNNLLEPLRIDVRSHVPPENPFTYEGTDGAWNEEELHEAFVNASIIEVDTSSSGRYAPSSTLNGIGKPGHSIPTSSKESFDLSRTRIESLNLKVTKVGLLNRKDDVMEGGKKSSNRKWKSWSVILTGSQLLFFRDLALISSFSSDAAERSMPPPISSFRPDESFSVKDSIAVYDRLYAKYPNTFRFVLPDARQIILQAANEEDLNEWISRINYASTFKSTGIRMRPSGLSGEDALLTGVAAATSHLHDIQKRPDLPRSRSWDSNAPHVLMDMLTGPPTARPRLRRRVTMANSNAEFDSDVPVAPEIDGAEQFKATFDRVKAHLAADSSSLIPSDYNTHPSETDSDISDSPLSSPKSHESANFRLPSRSRIIKSKIHELDSKIVATQSQLDSDLRLIRNIAILTPFQKSTRSRLSAAVQSIGKRITQVRLELEKLKCHRIVLRRDLSSEGRSWNHSKRVALRVARETLQNRSKPANNITPKTTLSLDGLPSHEDISSSAFNSAVTPRPNSSTSGSFHSALGWLSSDEIDLLRDQHGSPKVDVFSSVSSLSSAHDASERSDIRQRSLSLSSNPHHLGPNPYDNEIEEVAEDWNQTRCAKRVSLIQVPSNIKILVRAKSS